MGIMKDAPPKTMSTGIINLPNGSVEGAFIIKDYRIAIKKIGTSPTFSIRGAIYKGEDSLLLVLLFKVNNNNIYLYKCFLNYFSAQRRVIDLLCDQDRVVIELKDMDYKRVKQVMMNNSIKDFIRSYRDAANCMATPNPQHLIDLGLQINSNYDTIEDLWDDLDYVT